MPKCAVYTESSRLIFPHINGPNALVDLRQHDTSNWRNVMKESLLEKFDVENGPLWRLTFLPNARYETETGSDVNDTSFPHEAFAFFAFTTA